MPNEKVVWPVLFGGRIENADAITGGVGLTAAGTSLSSSALAALDVIDSTNHAFLILNPMGEGSAPEPVMITAHTGGNVVATVVRGVSIPGFTGAAHAHPQGTFFVASTLPGIHVPRKSIDQAWAGDTLAGGPFDYDFDGDTTSLPSGWSWVNQGSSTYTEEWGAGRIDGQNSGGTSADSMRMIVRAVPAASSWLATAKLFGNASLPAGIFVVALLLRESSSGKLVTLHVTSVATADTPVVFASKWTNPTTVSAVYTNTRVPCLTPNYLRIRKNSATSWDFEVSPDGRGWASVTAAVNVSTFMTPDQIGFGVDYLQASGFGQVMCEWLRIR